MKIFLTATKDYNFYNFRRNFILKLLEIGHEVTLVCPYGKKIEYFTQRGCKFINIEVDRRGKNIFNDLKLTKDYFKIFRLKRPDLVLTYTTKCSVYPAFVCRLMKIPCIVNNAGLIETKGVLNIILNILYKIGYGKATCMMYQNSYERKYLNKLLNNRVYYRDLPGSGVDLQEFKFENYPNTDKKIIFNYVGRIVKIKGIEEFLKCAEIIKKEYPNTQFIIYGEYDEEHYKSKIEELSNRGIVKYAGSKLDIKPYIKQSHALIHTSYYEGMTNAVLEHSAMGRICIGSNIPGVREGIENEITGFLFRVGDINDLVAVVRKFLNLNDVQRREMSLAARKKMEMEFNRDIVTDIYLEEIKKIEN